MSYVVTSYKYRLNRFRLKMKIRKNFYLLQLKRYVTHQLISRTAPRLETWLVTHDPWAMKNTKWGRISSWAWGNLPEVNKENVAMRQAFLAPMEWDTRKQVDIEARIHGAEGTPPIPQGEYPREVIHPNGRHFVLTLKRSPYVAPTPTEEPLRTTGCAVPPIVYSYTVFKDGKNEERSFESSMPDISEIPVPRNIAFLKDPFPSQELVDVFATLAAPHEDVIESEHEAQAAEHLRQFPDTEPPGELPDEPLEPAATAPMDYKVPVHYPGDKPPTYLDHVAPVKAR